MSSFRRDKKDDDERSLCVFENLDIQTIMQEIKYFNATPIDTRKCIHILSKILYLLNQGEVLTTQEATNIFFASTMLFQSKDDKLRHLVYICLKELSSMAQDAITISSSLSKHVTGKEDICRAGAIRTLCKITDSTMMQTIDSYMKQAILDKNPVVNSAALVSALNVSDTLPDLSGSWVLEAQEAMTSDNAMVSYHAFGVVAHVLRKNRQTTEKLMTKLINFPLGSIFAICLLIRHAAKLANDDETEASETYLEFIESCLRHESEIIVYEAVYSLVNLKKPPRNISQVVSILQIFCSSSKITLRLAGVRTLATLAVRHPNTITENTVELKNLISDPNPSIAIYAVTANFATGPESSIDYLMNQVLRLLSVTCNELKIFVVEAIKSVCLKYPQKHETLVAFLGKMLRENGGIEYLSAIVEALIEIIEVNPEAKETGLAHLCEFLDECKHSSLTIRILHVLGYEGPNTSHPSIFIRFIYNRILLESEPVRVAAVTTLALFGAICRELLPDIKVLLAGCHIDDDDAVRDRAIFFSQILDSGDFQLIKDYIISVRVPNYTLLEKDLKEYLETTHDEPFDISTVPELKIEEKKSLPKREAVKVVCVEDLYEGQLKVVPGIEGIGRLLKTCKPVELTEPETEYRVTCVKHIYRQHVILQFECVNTLSDQFLENVLIKVKINQYYKNVSELACEQLIYGKQGSAFCLLKFPVMPIESLCSMKAMMEFVVRDCDPITGIPNRPVGYADSYCLEEVVIGCPEQFNNRAASDDWEVVWVKANAASEMIDRFTLPNMDITEGAEAVCHQVGLPITAISGDDVKEIKGGGLFREGTPTLIRARLEAANGNITMVMHCRSTRFEVAALVIGAVAS